MKISSVNEDVIWHKRRKFYSFITACKNGTNLFSKDVISKWTRRSVFLLKSCLQILKTTECQLTEYQLNNDVTITSFCFVNKSCLANSLFSNKMERLRMLQKWLSSGLHAAHWPDFIDKDSWSPSSPDMNPLDYHVWGSMLQNFCHLNPQPKDIWDWSQRFWRSGTSYHMTQSASRSRISGSVCELV